MHGAITQPSSMSTKRDRTSGVRGPSYQNRLEGKGRMRLRAVQCSEMVRAGRARHGRAVRARFVSSGDAERQLLSGFHTQSKTDVRQRMCEQNRRSTDQQRGWLEPR